MRPGEEPVDLHIFRVLKPPEDVQLSREDGEALLERLERNTLRADDRRVLGKILTDYVWLFFALREAKLSLKRLTALVCGEKPKPPKPPPADGAAGGGSAGGAATPTGSSQEVSSVPTPASRPDQKPPPPGHGRHGADGYRAAQTVECWHAE